MSPALPTVKAKECLRALERYGFFIDHHTGSHARLFHQTDPTRKITIPIHNKDLPAGTLKSILRQAGISVGEFIELLK
ncbi:MAG TPA: type II toxin-antitoxin system HicA family toxin [Terriglobia bacterium]|jgi:predicted RNA binding protein YcfA (HicA-like mRNA interferase family)